MKGIRRLILVFFLATLVVGGFSGICLADCPGDQGEYQYGWCTWYALSKRPDLPHFSGSAGNAGNWASSAEACGFPVGRIPVVGAIAVFSSAEVGNVGHVAYVESVDEESGSYTVSEMNWGVGCSPPDVICGPSPRPIASIDPRMRFIYKKGEQPPYPIMVSPNGNQFFEKGSNIPVSWAGANSAKEEYRIRIAVEEYESQGRFCAIRTYCETSWFGGCGMFICPVGGNCSFTDMPEGNYVIYISSRWVGSGIDRSYPIFAQGSFRVGVCVEGVSSLGKRQGRILGFGLSLVDHYCPTDVAAPTPVPSGTAIPTSTPRPTVSPSSTTIPFGIPRLVSPSDGSSFTSCQVPIFLDGLSIISCIS